MFVITLSGRPVQAVKSHDEAMSILALMRGTGMDCEIFEIPIWPEISEGLWFKSNGDH